MSLNAAAVRLMAEKGLSASDIADIMEAMESKRVPLSNAERQANHRAKIKAERNESNVTDRDAPLSLPPNENNSNPPTHTPENKPARVRGRSKPQHPAKPDDVSEKVWADFLIHRKAKAAPVTDSALDGIRREAGKAGWTMEAALGEAMARGWQGFKSDWVDKPKSPANDGGSFLAHLSGSGP